MFSTATQEQPLDAIGRRVEVLQGHLDALRRQQASVRAAATYGPYEVDGKLLQLKSRLAVAESSLAADLAADRSEFAVAAESELRSLDAYLERLQMQAAAQSGESREHAEAAIAELRKRRIALAERVARFGQASGDAWQGHKQELATACVELTRQADELAAFLGAGERR